MTRLRRLLRIASTVLRHRLDTLIDRERINHLPLRTLLRINPWRLKRANDENRGERLRLALESLGPIFIKFGQLLSTRRDLMPPDIADELAKLQDQVPPFGSREAIELIESELGKPVGELFAHFDPQPLASASVAQVHSATLFSGEEVVVKVVRPGIEKTIRQDIQLLHLLARLMERYLPDGRRLRPVEVVKEYEITILDELDLQREGANGTQLRRNFEGSDLLYVPEVHWDYSTHKVLVMERIHGIPVTDLDQLAAQGTDMRKLAERGVEIFFTQVFRDSFFHADMHPGNIFVSREHPHNPQYIAIDCAIIGTLSDFDQYYLARNLLAIFRRNYKEVAELHIECGWVPADTRASDFEAAIRSACEPIFEKPLGEISFGQLLIYLFQTARRFNMEVQPSLVLLQKTLLNIEGLGRQLYPQLDLWNTAQPFLEQWLTERYSPKRLLKQISSRAPGWLEQLPKLPDTLFSHLQQVTHLEQIGATQQQQLDQLREQLAQQRSQRRYTTVGVLLLMGALLTARPEIYHQLLALPSITLGLIVAGGVLLLKR